MITTEEACCAECDGTCDGVSQSQSMWQLPYNDWPDTFVSGPDGAMIEKRPLSDETGAYLCTWPEFGASWPMVGFVDTTSNTVVQLSWPEIKRALHLLFKVAADARSTGASLQPTADELGRLGVTDD